MPATDSTGKAAIVTGGSRGIGYSIADALLNHGFDVVISARDTRRLEQAAEKLNAGGRPGRAHSVRADVRNAAECRHLVEQAVERCGRLDLLVNNAGIGLFEPVLELDTPDWDAVIQTNLSAVFYCSHFALPHLIGAGESWIINIGSLAGKNAFPGGAAYNASKFGLIGFSEALMQEVRHDGVRVSYLMPGSVSTEFGMGVGDWKIQPEDIAQLVVDLLAMPPRTLPSRIEVRPSRPPRK